MNAKFKAFLALPLFASLLSSAHASFHEEKDHPVVEGVALYKGGSYFILQGVMNETQYKIAPPKKKVNCVKIRSKDMIPALSEIKRAPGIYAFRAPYVPHLINFFTEKETPSHGVIIGSTVGTVKPLYRKSYPRPPKHLLSFDFSRKMPPQAVGDLISFDGEEKTPPLKEGQLISWEDTEKAPSQRVGPLISLGPIEKKEEKETHGAQYELLADIFSKSSPQASASASSEEGWLIDFPSGGLTSTTASSSRKRKDSK